MIFAISTDDRTLSAFHTEAEAISYCEGLDVVSGNWLFFGDKGFPLQATFTTSPQQSGIVVTNGLYHLEASFGPRLNEYLKDIVAIDGPKGFRSHEEIRAYCGA